MDKHLSKVMYREVGINTPGWLTVSKDKPIDFEKIINLPLMIKPATHGSSVGMKKAANKNELENAIANAFKWDDRVILEEFVQGREITGGVLGLDELTALPIVEICPGDKYEFFDYDAKYKEGATREICPADLPYEITKTAQDIALKAHKALQLRGYSRTDMIFKENGELTVLETNTIPGMTPTSLFPQAAKAAGISFPELLDRLIEMALASFSR
jgi:D-alanine-D-alanine ligase